MKVQGPLEGAEVTRTAALGLLLSWLVGSLLFVPLWAGLNFAFGTALDGPIGVFVMEPPCQRLAGTTEPLSRYTLGRGNKMRASSSVCHFASGPLRVADRPTEGLGFTGREFAYLMLGFAGYAVCFVGALALAFFLVHGGRRVVALALGSVGRGRSERSSPKRTKVLKRSKRRGARKR